MSTYTSCIPHPWPSTFGYVAPHRDLPIPWPRFYDQPRWRVLFNEPSPCVRNHGEAVTFVRICETVVTFWRCPRRARRDPGRVHEPRKAVSQMKEFTRKRACFSLGAKLWSGEGRRWSGEGGQCFHPKRSPYSSRVFSF